MFKVGDRVGNIAYGEGVVVSIDDHPQQPMLVRFDKENDELHSGSSTYVNLADEHTGYWWFGIDGSDFSCDIPKNKLTRRANA